MHKKDVMVATGLRRVTGNTYCNMDFYTLVLKQALSQLYASSQYPEERSQSKPILVYCD